MDASIFFLLILRRVRDYAQPKLLEDTYRRIVYDTKTCTIEK